RGGTFLTPADVLWAAELELPCEADTTATITASTATATTIAASLRRRICTVRSSPERAGRTPPVSSGPAVPVPAAASRGEAGAGTRAGSLRAAWSSSKSQFQRRGIARGMLFAPAAAWRRLLGLAHRGDGAMGGDGHRRPHRQRVVAGHAGEQHLADVTAVGP